ncbi:TonB-dependent receptor [Chitinophaga barathri]|nr:TonB-dependent receptor [Chitinophaga barathri]
MSRLTCLSLLFIMTASAVLMASGVKSQDLRDVRVKVTSSGAPLKTVLDELEKQSGFSFYFTEEIGNIPGVTIPKNAHSLYEVLREISNSKKLSYKQSGWMIAITKADVQPKAIPAKPGRISGRITDEKGDPLPGATIRVIETGGGTQSAVDGSYVLNLPPGVYTLEISYVSFVTRQITEVVITEGKTTPLSITMKVNTKGLKEVKVTSGYKKASIAALYAQQQNRAVLSDGISAEQIGATPDKHVGETLKRITGVSTTDNRKVVVRGIAERYNVSTLNGSTLPSTDVQERDFEFNMIPTNMVEDIVVAKSITPDMPYGFAGGLVQITTKSVPTSNFLSVTLGTSVNSRTVGKDFMGYQRGKYDYLGFDDGGRNHFPKGLFPVPYDYYSGFDPRETDARNKIKVAEVAEQNKRIGGTERLGARTYQAMPSQNYQLAIGRAYSLSKTKKRDLGFVGSLSYRNTQNNDYIASMRRGSWARKPANIDDVTDQNTGNNYGFTTTLGALLNGGFKTEKHQVNVYNLYTHIFDNQFSRITGWSHENPKDDGLSKFPSIREDDRPKFSDLLQNKISGQHRLGKINVEWNVARTQLNTVEKDAVTASLGGIEILNKAPLYQYYSGSAYAPEIGGFHRDQYVYDETNRSAELSAAYEFRLGKTSHTFKVGGNYLDKHASFDWTILPIVGTTPFKDALSVQEWGNHMKMDDKTNYLYYRPIGYSLNRFEGRSINKGAFVMIDSKLFDNLRIVGGIRAEYFRTDTLDSNASESVVYANMKMMLLDSVRTRWLPSVNITYSPVKNLNLRLAYSESMIRPGLMENSQFVRFSPNYGTVLRSRGVESTRIQNYDAKLEWFPGAGELLSATYFYKYFDKPAEYYSYDQSNTGNYDILITNSDWAKVSGWEFEIRKNLGFLYEGVPFLKNMFVSGNLTIQRSEVRSRDRNVKTVDGVDSVYYTYLKYRRALYGQIPRQYNLGLQYAGKKLGINVVYNYMGYKTFITGSDPNMIEYERPRGQLDAQISYRLLNGKMEAKLNISNLTDAPFRFFINDHSTYRIKPESEGLPDLEWNDRYEYQYGFSEKFEKGYIGTANGLKERIGDRETFTRYIGRTFSFSLSYNF